MSVDNIIIGLCGLKQAGKDTVADYLCKHYGFVKLSFAEKLKEIAVNAVKSHPPPGKDPEQAIYAIETKDKWGRWFLQLVGTEIGRAINENIWCDFTEQALYAKFRKGHNRIVLSDTRFPNEIAMLRKHGASIWKIICLDIVNTDAHESETAWQATKFDKVLIADKGDIKSFLQMAACGIKEQIKSRQQKP